MRATGSREASVAGSRTPVFALLRRAIATAMAAERSAMPRDEFVDAVNQQRRGRRQFLRQVGIGAGGLALAACGALPRTAPIRTDSEVVIVGAGVAGLTAAWRLRQAGVRVRIYEANTRVGGRVYSLRDHFPDGQVIELGGELIDTSHVRIQALCREFGLELDDLLADGTGLTPETWHFGGRTYEENDLIEALPSLARALRRDQARLPDEADVTWRAPHGLHDLDALTMAQWLDQAGVDGWLRGLIDVAYTTEMGAEPELQSALNLIDFIAVDEHFSIFGESDERFHVRGGNDLIVQALARQLDDVIQTGTVLEALRQRAGGGYTLSLRESRASRDIEADIVVLAIPFTTLRRVQLDLELPEVKRRAIHELGYGNNAKLMIGFSGRPWRGHGSNGSVFTDLPFQSTWETSRAQPGGAGILTNFTGGRHALAIGSGPAKDQADSAVRDLEQVFPGVAAARDGAREVRFHWPSQPWVMGSYACYGPGQWMTLRGVAGERVGGLLFAGEHCALDNQGFIEGACESGEQAAADALALLGLERHAAMSG